MIYFWQNECYFYYYYCWNKRKMIQITLIIIIVIVHICFYFNLKEVPSSSIHRRLLWYTPTLFDCKTPISHCCWDYYYYCLFAGIFPVISFFIKVNYTTFPYYFYYLKYCCCCLDFCSLRLAAYVSCLFPPFWRNLFSF